MAGNDLLAALARLAALMSELSETLNEVSSLVIEERASSSSVIHPSRSEVEVQCTRCGYTGPILAITYHICSADRILPQ